MRTSVVPSAILALNGAPESALGLLAIGEVTLNHSGTCGIAAPGPYTFT
jgi:hypothetical protein